MSLSDGDTDPMAGSETAGSVAVELRRRDTGPVVVGYTEGELLGRGGMGEVVLAHDQQIGRYVAIKRMRGQDPDEQSRVRFLREARVQARLEHPAIVPVYQLGTASDGTPFFTMKRLNGVTLRELIGASRVDLKAMLRALIDVCLAIEFAHSHHVVHRDLKPSNIMLGDFGEVYVLDWGLARVVGEDDTISTSDLSSEDTATQAGAVLGTPGYMAPEQIHGSDVGPAADVYALGTILFEVLAGEALHPHGHAGLADTLLTPAASPAQRRPDRTIPPELDDACFAALALEPEVRPSARELAGRIQRYLDGDRDGERRRTLASESVEVARAALASGDSIRRGAAMAAAGRALALDPESHDAAALISTMMLEVPRELPRELEGHLRDNDVELDVQAARTTAYAMLAILGGIPFLWWIGVKSWPMIGTIIGAVTGLALISAWMVRSRRTHMFAFMIGFAVLTVLMSRLFGPFIFVPAMLGISSASLIAQPGFVDRAWLPIGVAVAALLAPLALEELGVFGSSWVLAGDELQIRSGALVLDGIAAAVLLVASNVAMIVVNGLYAHALSVSRRNASRQLEIQAWHLRKLLPEHTSRTSRDAMSATRR